MNRQRIHQVDASVDASSDESVNQWLKEIGGRIKHARQLLNLTQDEFATEAGAKSKSGLQDNERGRSMPGGHIIGALAKKGINTNWIFTGEGDCWLQSGYQAGGAGSTVLVAAEPARLVDPLLLQSVTDFFFRWTDEHKVRVERSKIGAVIAILYRIAASRGTVVIEELEQVLHVAA